MRGAIDVQNKIYASLPRGVLKLSSFRCIFCCNNEDACLLIAKRTLCLIFWGLRAITVKLRDWNNIPTYFHVLKFIHTCICV